jgi:L-alanine-DL-glutamate epimerase-like enolase superfamily enzyme
LADNGEWQATHHEFEELMDRGKIDVAQPDADRSSTSHQSHHFSAFSRARYTP